MALLTANAAMSHVADDAELQLFLVVLLLEEPGYLSIIYHYMFRVLKEVGLLIGINKKHLARLESLGVGL